MSKRLLAVLILGLALGLAGCGGGDDGGGGDLLSSIEDKGALTVSTDPAYPPQSELNKKTNEYEGFDIDVATEIAKRLGVDVAWQAPAWETIISGNWAGRWDASVGSMTTHRSARRFWTPAAVLLHTCGHRRARGQHDRLECVRPRRQEDRRVRRMHVRHISPGEAEHRPGRVRRA